MARTLITMPATVRRGELIEIRCLIGHPMETGYRRADDGQLLPRDLIRRFECFAGEHLVFSAELFAAVAANPLISFWLRAEASGTLRFHWQGDRGFAQTEERTLTVI
ncbi:thiosulfate oxidation carrier complex protein SoxZ [Roseateles violae]|uniref:Thiosulfate oxidation carrier complex protein SoxZ n=1 Tax=Roseateles violae TaxID=3058042 RepID=A0ABT8DW73_9BURK|nr:thiosulfate oxidation carrier complex protein SoxZ [Pelomonas sp. PFR6]MDN3920416.1 thiosulfate oxidation carrier complex protein SoxZ [Pelomonas sp. PFR6]